MKVTKADLRRDGWLIADTGEFWVHPKYSDSFSWREFLFDEACEKFKQSKENGE